MEMGDIVMAEMETVTDPDTGESMVEMKIYLDFCAELLSQVPPDDLPAEGPGSIPSRQEACQQAEKMILDRVAESKENEGQRERFLAEVQTLEMYHPCTRNLLSSLGSD